MAMISGMRIELGHPSDAHEISKLSSIAIEQGLRQTWTAHRVRNALEDAETNVAVARDGARVVGFGIMTYADASAHLNLLAVDAAYRRRGIGSALLAWLEKCARTAGLAVVKAEVRFENPAGRAFYRANGFAEGERLVGYYQGIEDALRLQKRVYTPS